MNKMTVVKGFNDWVKVLRKVPTTMSGLHLPNTAQSGRSTWFMDQDLPKLDLKKGDQIIPAPEVWLYKVNPDDENDNHFMMKHDMILAKVEEETSNIVTG